MNPIADLTGLLLYKGIWMLELGRKGLSNIPLDHVVLAGESFIFRKKLYNSLVDKCL